jgi:hypothetical protein
MKKFVIIAEYKVSESIEVEAENYEEAEEKALELLAMGATNRNIVDDDSDYAEIVDGREIKPETKE